MDSCPKCIQNKIATQHFQQESKPAFETVVLFLVLVSGRTEWQWGLSRQRQMSSKAAAAGVLGSWRAGNRSALRSPI